MDTQIIIVRRKRKPSLINVAKFRTQVPISRRTFSDLKLRYGDKVLLDIFNVLSSGKKLGIIKREYYDGFKNVSENTLDLIWEMYVDKRIENGLT